MSEQYFDAVIIGAGISGISAAYNLRTHNPNKTYAVLERRPSLGGTWDLFNYPGIRSDSDMYTFGFSFRPWDDKSAIAEKAKILEYLHATVKEFEIDQRIHYNQHIVKAQWSSQASQWRLETADGDYYTCQFLYMCSGYYSYDEAYTPEFAGIEEFAGEVLHPQFWPEDADYKDKNVVVIGSGATAITLVPAMAKQAKHVTMLQRSPTYLGSKPAEDPIANRLGDWFGRWAARWWFIMNTMFIFLFSKAFPNKTKELMLKDIKKMLGDKYEERHFSPYYNPWDQRVCLCPDADFFNAIKNGKASIETGHIERFTEHGVLTQSGKEIPADMIVTATGLKIQLFGGIDILIDDKPFKQTESYVYKGMMISGVPNAFLAAGYTNASWTLKVDLTNRYASRLIAYMDKQGHKTCMAHASADLQDSPLLNLSSGYIQRSIDTLPKQATTKPWRLHQNYILDNIDLRLSPLTDKNMVFS